MKEKFSKKTVIVVFCLLAAIMAGIILFHHNPNADQNEELLKKAISCSVIVASCVLFGLLYDKIISLPVELFQSRHLIWKLAKNDFKKRYAGSYLGIVWALVQPVITVLMYWLVFDVIMSGHGDEGRNRDSVRVVFDLRSGAVVLLQ